VDVVNYSAEAVLMAVLVDGEVYILDKDELAMTGATLLRILAEGRQLTPEMLPVILRRPDS
jgi:hypothetical protein